MYSDYLYTKYGDYFSSDDPALIAPFSPLITVKRLPDNPYALKKVNNEVSLVTSQSVRTGKYNLVLPSIQESGGQYVSVQRTDDKVSIVGIFPKIKINGIIYEATSKQVAIHLSDATQDAVIELTETEQLVTNNGILYIKSGFPNILKVTQGITSQLYSIDSSQFAPDEKRIAIELDKTLDAELIFNNRLSESIISGCRQIEPTEQMQNMGLWKSNLYHNESHIILGEYHHKQGLPLQMYIDNPVSKLPEVEYKLSLSEQDFLLYIPSFKHSTQKGYGLQLLTKQYATAHKSEVCNVWSYYVWEKYMENVELVRNVQNTSVPIFSHTQAFDPGWLAYDLTGANWLQRQMPVLFADSLRLKDHVLVNNWANGWRLSQAVEGKIQNEKGKIDTFVGGVDPGSRSGMTDQRQITVIFWPQYLQYLGFAVLLVTMGVLIIPQIRHSNS
jgi:hypothetical protein